MTLEQLAVMALATLAYLVLIPARWRSWYLLLASVIVVYWLQPSLRINWLDYSLASVLIVLTMISWLLTRPKTIPDEGKTQTQRENWFAFALILAVILLIAVTRYVSIDLGLTSRPPEITGVLLALVIAGIAAFALWFVRGQRWVPWLLIGVILLLFVVVQNETARVWLSGILRTQAGQDAGLADAFDIRWIGFAYIVLRLLHTIRDRQTGTLSDVSLREYVTYVLFYPAIIVGPVDRLERFIIDFRALPLMSRLDANRLVEGARRVVVGIFKKFVLADLLLLVALNDVNALQTDSIAYLWLLLFAFAFWFYLELGGLTDIAIGFGIITGFKLPENFRNPYWKPNLAEFWRSWNISVVDWFRHYVYDPISGRNPDGFLIFALATLSMMITFGLWHSISLALLIWGLWHAVGLILHRVWRIVIAGRFENLPENRLLHGFGTVCGIVLTFLYVSLGWVWLALPDAEAAIQTIQRLLGAG